jgi:hypothetical protein
MGTQGILSLDSKAKILSSQSQKDIIFIYQTKKNKSSSIVQKVTKKTA